MNSTRRPDPRRLDVAQLAAAGAEVAGEWPHDGFARLAAATLPAESEAESVVTFSASGLRAQLATLEERWLELETLREAELC